MDNNTDVVAKLIGKSVPAPIAELLSQLSGPELFRELMRLVPMSEAERLSSLSEETLRREYGHMVEQVSPRRNAMRVVNALMLRPP